MSCAKTGWRGFGAPLSPGLAHQPELPLAFRQQALDAVQYKSASVPYTEIRCRPANASQFPEWW